MRKYFTLLKLNQSLVQITNATFSFDVLKNSK